MMTFKRWLVAGGSAALTVLGFVVNNVELAIASAAAFGWSMPWLRDVRVIEAARLVLAAFQHERPRMRLPEAPGMRVTEAAEAQARALDALAREVPHKNGPPK